MELASAFRHACVFRILAEREICVCALADTHVVT